MRWNDDLIRRIIAIVLAVMLCCGDLLAPAASWVTYAQAEPVTETVMETTTPAPTEEAESSVVAVNDEPTETPTEKPTEEPTEAPTEKPTEEPTEAPTEKPTEAPTEAPTEKPTEVPTEEPTETPTEEPTEVPTEAPTEEPTEEPTEAPTEEPTEEPTAEPTEEPTPTPVPALEILGVNSSKADYQIGETLIWSVKTSGAQEVRYVITNQAGASVAEGLVDADGKVAFAASSADVYRITVTAVRGEESVSASSTASVQDGDVMVSLYSGARYVVAGQQSLSYQAAVGGGVAPYTLKVSITRAEETVHTEEQILSEAGVSSIIYTPDHFGIHVVTAEVTDALGHTCTATADIPVATDAHEYPADWEASVQGVKLSGDWREDLVAIARTQLGVEESSRNFIIDEDGKKLGYTRYGDWYGSLYGDWCGMFVSFCLNFADVPRSAFPREAHVDEWRSALRSIGAWETELHDYQPQKGDLVFFDWNTNGDLDHMGIVSAVTDTTLYTIEGNSRSMVRENSYDLSDGEIAAYGSMRKAMKRAGVLDRFEQIDLTVNLLPTTEPGEQLDVVVPLETAEQGVSARTNKPGVNLRAKPGLRSKKVGQLPLDAEVRVIGRAEYKGETWYLVNADGVEAYILGELLNLDVSITVSATETEEPLPTESPAVTETPTLTEAPAESEQPEVTEQPEIVCTCEAQPNEAGEVVHAEDCALNAVEETEVPAETEQPEIVCTCEAQPNEAGEVVHAEDCALNAVEKTEVPAETEQPEIVCTCEAQPNEAGEVVHAEDCALNAVEETEVPAETEQPEAVCTCEAQPNEAGEVVHAEDCALNAVEKTEVPAETEQPEIVCTCEAQPNEAGEVVHAEDCALNAVEETEVPAETEQPEAVCTCEAQPNEAGEVVHAEDCALNAVDPEETEVSAETEETQQPETHEDEVVQAFYGEEVHFEVPYEENAAYQWQRREHSSESSEWTDIEDDAVAFGWNTNRLTVVVNAESIRYEYRCYIEKNEPEDEAVPAAAVFEFLFGIRRALAQEGEYSQSFLIAPIADEENPVQSSAINLGGYNQNLIIFNYLYYTTYNSTDPTGNGGGTTLAVSGSKENIDINIGDFGSEGNAAPLNSDINLSIQDNQNLVTVRSVNRGSNQVNMTIANSTSMKKLVLEAGAKLHLVLEGNLNITEVTLAADAQLIVDNNGDYTFSIGKMTVEQQNGKQSQISLEGAVAIQTAINADQLNIVNAHISGSAAAVVTARNSISVNNSTISGLGLFGFDSNANSECILVFANQCTVDGVARVGAAEDCTSRVTVDQTGVGGARSVAADYAITYAEETTTGTAAKIETNAENWPNETWPEYYRTLSVYEGDTATHTIIGSHQHTDKGTAYQKLTEESLDLPVHVLPCYSFDGWKMEGTEEAVTKMPSMMGDVIFTAVQTADPITVVLDPGYTPVKGETNDEMPVYASGEYTYGQVFTLLDQQATPVQPSRFGYTFEGWNVLNADGTLKAQLGKAENYTIKDLTHIIDLSTEEEKVYSLSLQAQWTPMVFPIILGISSDISKLQVTVSLNEQGTENWVDLAQFLQDNSALFTRSEDGNISLTNPSLYGIRFDETLDDWYNRLGKMQNAANEWFFPRLNMNDESSKQQFTNWTYQGLNVAGASSMNNADGGLMNTSEYTKLNDYLDDLGEAPMVFMAKFASEAKLSVSNMTEGWSIWTSPKGDKVAKTQIFPDENGVITKSIEIGSTVFLRVSDDYASEFAMGSSAWAFEFAPEFQSVFESLALTAIEYKESNGYMDFYFVMPGFDITAVHHNLHDKTETAKIEINLYDSPIAFQKSYTTHGVTYSGFWYEKQLSTILPLEKANGLYFYVWDYNQAFNVTTGGKGTTNQLTLDAAITVNLRDCVMEPNSAYLADFAGTTVSSERTNAGKYGNIVFGSKNTPSYAAALYIDGTSSIGMITQDTIRDNASYRSTVRIYGKNPSRGERQDTIYIGSVWGNFSGSFNNLNVKQHPKTNGDYLAYFFSGNGNISFNNCQIDAKDKRLYVAGNQTISFDKTEYGSTDAVLKSTYSASTTHVKGSSRVRVLGNLSTSYASVNVEAGSTLLVGGSVTSTWTHGNSGASIGGTLIVLGNYCDLINMEMKSSSDALVVANVVTLSNVCTVSAGTIVTNHIMNSLDSQSGSTKAYNAYNDNAYLGIDIYPASEAGEKIYKFTGGNVYLMDTKYTGETTAEDGLIGDILTNQLQLTLPDENAENQRAWSITKPKTDELNTALRSIVTNNRTGDNLKQEGFILGNTSWTLEGDYPRRVNFAGANIYAVGNITTFNETNITGGTIECNLLTSKQQMNVSGNAVIKAEGVGNSYDVTVDKGSGLKRYVKTVISGGKLVVNSIGAVGADIADHSACGVLTVNGTADIAPKDGETILVRNVLYANYVGSEALFSIPENNVRSLVFEAEIDAYNAAGNTEYPFSGKLEMSKDVAFSMPKLLDENKKETGEEGSWTYDSLGGVETQKVLTNGTIEQDTENAVGYVYKDHDSFDLYAVKNTYNLTVLGDYDGSFTVTAEGISTEDSLVKNGSLQVGAGKTVTVALSNETMYARTVVWYRDGADTPVNVLAQSSEDVEWDAENHTISFPMPLNDTEIWITETLELDIAKYYLAFTSSGFRVEWGENPERAFAYAGNLYIVQSNVGDISIRTNTAEVDKIVSSDEMVRNYFRFEEGADAVDRDITLHRIVQVGEESDGNTVAVGIQAKLKIDGVVQLVHTVLGQDAGITIEGANENAWRNNEYVWNDGTTSFGKVLSGKTMNKDVDVLHVYPKGYVGSTSAQIREVNFSKLYIIGNKSSTIVQTKSKATSGLFRMEDCTYHNMGFYSGGGLVKDVPDVWIEDCRIETYNSSWFYGIFQTIQNLTIKGGYAAMQVGSGSSHECGLFEAVRNVTLDGAYLKQTNRNAELGINASKDYAHIKLINGSTYTANRQLYVDTLTIEDGSSLILTNDHANLENILMCSNLNVVDGTVIADNIVLSGYLMKNDDKIYDTPDDIVKYLNENDSKYVKTSGQLTLTSGSIGSADAPVKFIGGDSNATININGGQVYADGMGTSGLLYGCTYTLLPSPEKYFYTTPVYESKAKNLNIGAEVNITGGTVNVSANGYVGGVGSSVNVEGGKVLLGENAVLGMTEAQGETYREKRNTRTISPVSVTVNGTGKVEHTGADTYTNCGAHGAGVDAPYGTVTITGTQAGVHVDRITANNGGTVNINGTGAEFYTNPHAGAQPGHEMVNVRVNDLLQPGSNLVLHDVVVYAGNAYVNPEKGQKGSFVVSEDPATELDTRLYVGGNFGKAPKSEGDFVVDALTQQYITGSQQRAIIYVLNEQQAEYADNEVIDTLNLRNTFPYNPTADDTEVHSIEGYDPVWFGRKFIGWYDNAELEGDPVTAVQVNKERHTLYAKWEFDAIPFSITVKPGSGLSAEEYAAEVAGLNGYHNTMEGSESFTFQEVVNVPYTANIVNTLNLDKNFQMNSKRVMEVKFAHDDTITVSEVTTPIYRLYKEKVANNQVTNLGLGEQNIPTVELIAVHTGPKVLTITLDMNLPEGCSSTPELDTEKAYELDSNRYIGTVQNGMTLKQGMGEGTDAANVFLNDGMLVEAKATGYVFDGWFTEPQDGVQININALPVTHTTYYAHWTAKAYLLSFDAGEQTDGENTIDNLITKDAQTPEASAPRTMYALIRYDQPLNQLEYVEKQADGTWAAVEQTTGAPRAWSKGQAFSGWFSSLEAPEQNALTGDSCFNTLTVKHMDAEKSVDLLQKLNPAEENLSAALQAQYEESIFHFYVDENDGAYFRDEDGNAAGTEMKNVVRRLHEPFPGYIRLAVGASAPGGYTSEYFLLCEDGAYSFHVLSTSADAYAAEPVFKTDDFRNTLQRPGYTFVGWFATPEDAKEANPAKAVGAVALYPSELETNLYAGWRANEYNVNLKEPDPSEHVKYVTPGGEKKAKVVVGSVINHDNWPKRNITNPWYAYSGNDKNANNRNLLGFTFESLDPGNSIPASNGYAVYLDYAVAINALTNQGLIFNTKEGTGASSVFILPYGQDYPNGSTIDMYAVYRERSLVFVEVYDDDEGNHYEKVMHSANVHTFSDYPWNAYQKDKAQYLKDNEKNYQLEHWKVNNSDEIEYPKTADAYRKDNANGAGGTGLYYQTFNGKTILDIAADIGTYDVYVYSVYSAKAVQDIQMLSDRSPANYIDYKSGSVPTSMKEDIMSYKLDVPEGIHLVSKEIVDKNRYNNGTWVDLDGNELQGYNANNTVAIYWDLMDDKGDSKLDKPQLLSERSTPLKMFDGAVAPKWRVYFTMYHSSVISEPGKKFTLPVECTFETNTNQQLTLNVNVDLRPTQYKLMYRFNIPETEENVSFDEEVYKLISTQNHVHTYELLQKSTVTYGSELETPESMPQFTGFELQMPWQWLEGDDATEWLDKDTYSFDGEVMKANANTATLVSEYKRSDFSLFTDEYTRRMAIVSYTPENGQMSLLGDVNEQKLGYRTQVNVTSIGADETLTITKTVDGEQVAVDYTTENTAQGTVYTFLMPTANVTIKVVKHQQLAKTLMASESIDKDAVNDSAALSVAAELSGLELTLKEEPVLSGITLDGKADVKAKQFNAGRSYANTTFALQFALDTAEKQDVKALTAGYSAGFTADGSLLNVDLYNANAITAPGVAGTVTLVFETERGDTITLTLTIDRTPVRINVTVPLVLVMKTNIDGGTADVDDNAYHIDNDSSTQLKLTQMTVKDETSSVITQDSSTASLNTLRDKYRVNRKADWQNKPLEADGSTAADGKPTDQYNPIDSVATSPLTFVTKDDETMGVQMATITYTVSVPE